MVFPPFINGMYPPMTLPDLDIDDGPTDYVASGLVPVLTPSSQSGGELPVVCQRRWIRTPARR